MAEHYCAGGPPAEFRTLRVRPGTVTEIRETNGAGVD
jgi:hypothetical protein